MQWHMNNSIVNCRHAPRARGTGTNNLQQGNQPANSDIHPAFLADSRGRGSKISAKNTQLSAVCQCSHPQALPHSEYDQHDCTRCCSCSVELQLANPLEAITKHFSVLVSLSAWSHVKMTGEAVGGSTPSSESLDRGDAYLQWRYNAVRRAISRATMQPFAMQPQVLGFEVGQRWIQLIMRAAASPRLLTAPTGTHACRQWKLQGQVHIEL